MSKKPSRFAWTLRENVQAHPIRLELLIKAELGQPFVDRKTRILHDEYNYEADRVNID